MEKYQYLYLLIVIIVAALIVVVVLLWKLILSHLCFKAICNNSGNMVVIGRAVIDKKQRVFDVEIIDCNAVYASHLGKSIKDVIGLYIIKDLFAGAEPDWFDVVREVIMTHESRHLEFAYEPLDKRYTGSVFCLSPLLKRCCFIMDEIAMEYKQRMELQQSYEMMDSVLRVSGVGLWNWNLKTQSFTVIKSIFSQAERNPIQVVPLTDVFNILHPDDRSVFAQFTQTQQKKAWGEMSAVFRLKDLQGEWHWMQAVAVRMDYDSVGNLEKMDGVTLDIDLLKQAQIKLEEVSEELRKKQRQLLDTLQHCRTGICSWDIESDRIDFGENFWESIGGLSAEFSGTVPGTMEELKAYVISEPSDAFSEWHNAMRLGKRADAENHFRCQVIFLPDVWLEVRNSIAEREASGKPLVINAVVINITEIKKHEEALTLAMRDTDEASQAKNRFLAVMSHEIRTPLNAIIGFSSIINKADVSEKVHSYSESIKSSGEMLLTLINDLLDLAKIESEKMRLNLQPVSLQSLLNELSEMFALKVKIKGLYLQIHSPDNMPLLYLDAKRLKQIFINLIGNAVKFTNIGGITITVNCGQGEDSDSTRDWRKLRRVVISVKDTGEGILQQDFASIFNPFEQVAVRKGEYVEGSGLGLSICKNLVELMGGRITCTSEVGVGSDFVVALENVEISDGKSRKIDAEACVLSAEIKGNSPVTADESELHAKVFAGIVEKFGGQFHEMQNGMHVQSSRLLVSELQEWMAEYEVPQIQLIVNSLEKAVEDFDVTELKRLSKFLLKQGMDNGR